MEKGILPGTGTVAGEGLGIVGFFSVGEGCNTVVGVSATHHMLVTGWFHGLRIQEGLRKRKRNEKRERETLDGYCFSFVFKVCKTLYLFLFIYLFIVREW